MLLVAPDELTDLLKQLAHLFLSSKRKPT